MSNRRRIRPARHQRRPAKRQRRTTSPFLLALIGVAVLGAIAAVAAGIGSDDDDGLLAEATAPVDVSGEPLAQYEKGGADPAVGRAAPEVVGTGLDAPQVTLPGSGPQAIVFLAHWCPHCQAEVDALTDALARRPVPDGVRLVSVSTLVAPRRANFPPDQWLRDAGWPAPVLVDDEDSSTAVAYGLAGTPFWVFVDAEGHVVERVSGEIDSDVLLDRLERLAAGA